MSLTQICADRWATRSTQRLPLSTTPPQSILLLHPASSQLPHALLLPSAPPDAARAPALHSAASTPQGSCGPLHHREGLCGPLRRCAAVPPSPNHILQSYRPTTPFPAWLRRRRTVEGAPSSREGDGPLKELRAAEEACPLPTTVTYNI
jgi:hypothetical protein